MIFGMFESLGNVRDRTKVLVQFVYEPTCKVGLWYHVYMGEFVSICLDFGPINLT